MRLLKIFYFSGKYSVDKEKSRTASRWPQYAGALAANLSVLAVGTILAWTSPASTHLLSGEVGFKISESELSIIGSLMPIGAAVSCIPTGYLTDRIGRKMMLLALTPVFLLGWGLIIWPINIEMLYGGRFICGLCVGATCVTAPVFTAEISQTEIRGELGSYFHMMLAIGILYAYIVGSQLNVFFLSIACAVVPILLGITMLFFPETPIYYLLKGEDNAARKSLKFYRGAHYDFDLEMSELTSTTNRTNEKENSSWTAFKSKAGIKALYMSVGLMAFQQLSGINAVTFYTTSIFQDTNSSIEPRYATVIVGFIQFAGTFLAMFLIDRAGRVILLGSSAAAMAICSLIMGLYFYLKRNEYYVEDFSWVPLASLCVFCIMFSVGYGTIPWAYMSEVIPPRIKGTASSIACIVNWLCAFLVTKFFPDLVNLFGSDVAFWIFSGITIIGAVFSFKCLPETRGKSFEEIQTEISS